MVPMVLQQMINFDEENLPLQPVSVVRNTKKKKTAAVIVEDSISDSSSDSLTMEHNNDTNNLPIQRPKRTKAQHLLKSRSTN